MTTKSIERATITIVTTIFISLTVGGGTYHLLRESGRPPALSLLLALLATSGLSGVTYAAMRCSNQEADEADTRPSNIFARQVELVNTSVEEANGLVARVNKSVDRVSDNPELYGQTFKEGAALIDSSTRALDSSTRALEISRQALQEARAFDQQLTLAGNHGTNHLLSPTHPSRPNVLPFAKPIRIHASDADSNAEGEGCGARREEISSHCDDLDSDNGICDRANSRFLTRTGPSPCDIDITSNDSDSSYLPLTYL
jgi:hypothetical protein